jgi:hypothetical protein
MLSSRVYTDGFIAARKCFHSKAHLHDASAVSLTNISCKSGNVGGWSFASVFATKKSMEIEISCQAVRLHTRVYMMQE